MIQKSSLQFLEQLKQNNNREWFQSQAKAYQLYKADYHQIIQKTLDALVPLDIQLANLEVKNCTFRINRDIRFSKDKSPYKTHMSFWFTRNKHQKNFPGYYVHLEGNQSFVAGGLWGPDAEQLQLIRKEIAFFYEDLEAALLDKNFLKYYNGLDSDPNLMLKTSPKGFEKDHPAINWLRYKSFTCSSYFEAKEAFEPEFVSQIAQKLIALKPLNEFLERALTEN